MSTASIELAKHVLMVFGIILAVGAVSAVLARKLKVPDVVVFLVLGTLLGPGAIGIIDVKADSALNQLVLIFGSCYILFDGGASLRFKVLKEVWITIVILAVAGVADYRCDHRARCLLLTRGSLHRRVAAGFHNRVHRSRDARAGFPPGEDQGPRSADGHVRIGF